MPHKLLDKARKAVQDLGCSIFKETNPWRETFLKGKTVNGLSVKKMPKKRAKALKTDYRMFL